jgi:phosphatidylglycerol---prolipoprotein diacylglyceryl transferase
VAGPLVWAQRRYRLSDGRLFALYVAAYTVGRGWIEALRVDHANHILGLRLNDWTSLIIFVAAVAHLWKAPRDRVDNTSAQPVRDPAATGAER